MKQSIYYRLNSVLWSAIVILIVLLAIYVSMGRMLTSLTGTYQREILQELNYRVPFLIDADRVSAEWHSFTPVLVLNGLRLTLPGELERSIELSEGRVALDVAGSLFSRSPQMTHLRLNGLNLAGELGEDGRLRIRGFDGGDKQLGAWLEESLSNLEWVALDNIHLDLFFSDGEQSGFDLNLALSREGSRRRLEGNLSSSGGLEVFALAEGVGNPFKPESFTGQLYLDIDADEVGAITDLLDGQLQDVLLDGSLDLEIWSTWDEGELGAELRLGANDVLFSAANASWQVPFDRLALDASLESRKDGWALTVAGLELARGEALLQLPRLQLDLRGETLKLQAQGLPLAPFSQLLAGMDLLSPAVVDLIKVLQPRGVVPALQLNVADIGVPLAAWELQANFNEVAVDAWHGVPGVTGASGYTRLLPGSGLVVLDSQKFSMSFPTVYEQPLRYDDFHGTINIKWDEEAVALSSGLVEAHGEEGPVRALFGLSIPLVPTEVGLEMDLLVGLENTEAVHRGKYIPYTLNKKLRSWLVASIGNGLVEQGGFLWRGSLKPGSPVPHTVQLFFNVRDVALSYHPDWPPLTHVDGTVLIDDDNVSVWAATAQLLDSRVSDLSVEVWADEAAELWLAVDGRLAGPAADGLAVINQSPLRQLVGGVFTDWQLEGELETSLELLLDLTDKKVPPGIEVSAHFTDVNLDIRPGKLPLRGVSGVLDYDSSVGFSSRDLVGNLWGRPLEASVEQYPVVAESNATAVALATVVDMSDIRQWLGLDLLDFVQGQTAVTMELLTGAGALPTLSIDSMLAGVSLDLPSPWGKPAGVERPLHLALTLGGDSLLLGIEMADGLASELELVDGKLRSAVLALASEPTELQAGQASISGHMEYLDTSEWQRFLVDYLGDDSALTGSGGDRQQLALSIDQLQVDQLVVGGRDLGEVVLSLADDGGHWRVSAEADWLRGELLYVAGGRSLLDIEYLDLAKLDSLDLAVGDEIHIIELPELAVTIDELRSADTLLGNLAFDLRSDGADLSAQNIRGEIAAMQLRFGEPGELVWHQGPNSHTAIEAKLHFQNIGETLDQLGYQEIIVTEDGSFELALDWPGGPQDFSLLQGQGSFRVDMGEGHFPEVPGGAAGALRVASILNLTEIVQRLSLNQMFESGIPFNEVEGEVFLHAGTIEVASMDVQGSAGSFHFSGVSTVKSRTLDGELVVTLPVANNLPWVAALAAGLPVAAGVFVLSKVFESQFNRLTSVVYTASGTWDEPEVKFDRVFDDTATADTGADEPDSAPQVALPGPPIPIQSESP